MPTKCFSSFILEDTKLSTFLAFGLAVGHTVCLLLFTWRGQNNYIILFQTIV